MARGLFAELLDDHDTIVPQIAGPIVSNGVRQSATCPPPRLGQDNDGLLAELGYDVGALRAAGIV
jgi:crotonobetainyl-CoA:carnitine CoA-transferase CaiB-like acyl-CoA transferase